ncbi:hypothetical protein PG993_005071 [Apiospora rasikravindrae]|uniref:Uncharacterized protein n=1 Tax=Apiospora rasikravindrae TaxID=990691 RepID=A0ABR1TEK1_9PEZI
MLSVRQTLRASTRATTSNAAVLQRTPGSAFRAPFRLASSTTGGTSTDLRSEKTDPAQNQKPDDKRQTNDASQTSKGSNQGNGDNTGKDKGKQ